jgi:hypothetical protein
MIKRIYHLSNGSAGARTIATASTTEGLPMSRYIASKRMKELNLVSCQLPINEAVTSMWLFQMRSIVSLIQISQTEFGVVM